MPSAATSAPVTPVPSAPVASAPATTPAPASPVAAPSVTNPDTVDTPAAAQPPINKGRLIALIAIIAGLIFAGIIAAILIVLLTNNKPNPTANAEAALTNLASPADAPTSISGNIELVNGDDTLASASAVLEGSNLFFDFDGVSSLLESYLGLDSVSDQESISSLVVIQSLLQFAEDAWWQVPVEDLTIAAEYRAHPFLVLVSADNSQYHVRIDADQFVDFLSALNLKLTLEETDCTTDTEASMDADGDTATEATDCAAAFDLSYLGLTNMPSTEQIKSAVSSIDILATIDAENRFTSFYAILSDDDFVVNIKLDLAYAGTSFSPEEYRPITELMSQFLQAIGY